jgi:uncharacterized protein YcnI
VILRCSPSSASLEGWATSARGPSFETPRKRAAPQNDGQMCGSEKEFMNISRAGSKNDALQIAATKINSAALANAKRNRV